MKKTTIRDMCATSAQRSSVGWVRFYALLFIVIQLTACSKPVDNPKQPAKAPEPKNQTYRMIGNRSVISLVSSDELEIREGGQNIVCKYSKQDGKLRVVVSALGTTTAKYFNMTPQGLVDETGGTYYEPATYEKVMAQIELNSKFLKAVESNDSNGINDLVQKGASLETYDARGTALTIAILGGLTNSVNALLMNGANPNARTPDGSTPLMLAVDHRGGWGEEPRKPEHDKIVSLLCEKKADLNLTDKDGNTALARSLKSGNLVATRILVAAGADRNIGKESGHDAFSYAKGDEDKNDALRTPEEREVARANMEKLKQMFVGTWRTDNWGVKTFRSDGYYRNGGETEDQPWSIHGDIFTLNTLTFKIVEIGDSHFFMERLGYGGDIRATRVP